jgi:hypothetical protein
VKKATIPARSRFASLVSLEDVETMRARLRDPKVELTMDERWHIAADWEPRRGKRGKPAQSLILKRSGAIAVARSFLAHFHACRTRYGATVSNRGKAKKRTAQEYGCSVRAVEGYLKIAREHVNGEWWRAASRLQRKGKLEKLRRY